MTNFNFVKIVYSWGLDIKGYVDGWITAEQYREITGKDYE